MEPSKNALLFQKWFISPSVLKIWKREPARFLKTLQHKGAENMGNHMEPSKKIHFCSKNDLFHQAGLKFKKKKKKWEPARFQLTY